MGASEARRRLEHDLVVEHLSLVRRVAHRLARRLPEHVDLTDLVSAGNEGLVDAASRYDPSRGDTFAAYSEWRIKYAIIDDIRKRDSLSRYSRGMSNAIAEAVGRLEGTTGQTPTHDELAAEMGMTPVELHAQRQRLDGHTVVGFDDVRAGRLERSIRDPAPSAFEYVASAQARAHLDEAIRTLSPREQQVLALRFVEELTLAEIGAVLGVGDSRVCQIVREVTRRLRGLVDADLALGGG